MATRLGVDGITLNMLWNVDLSKLKDKCYLRNPGEPGNPSKTKKEYWDDYCAIKLSERLIQSGFSMPSKASSPYKQCHSHRQDPDNAHHFVLAEQMAGWLTKKPIPGLPDVKKYTGENFEEALNDKKGLIFFKDYWVDNGVQSGDHIDVWKNGRTPNASNWQREMAELLPNFLGGVSHFENSKEVWFWELE